MWRALIALLWLTSAAHAQGVATAIIPLMNGYSSIGPNTSFPAPTLMPSFTGTNNNPALTAFLATGCGPGLRIVSGGSQNTQDKPNIARQCQLGDTLGDYIPMCAMNVDPGQCGNAGTKYMGNSIDGFAVGQASNGFSHTTWLYVNEPAYNNVDYGQQITSGYVTQQVSSVPVTNQGSGYTVAPAVAFTGGTAIVAATATANIGTGGSAGKIVSITITNAGDYSVPPTGSTLTGGDGASAASGTPVIASVLFVTSGTFTDSLGENTILCYGLNNCTGNYITGVLTGSGQVGTYSMHSLQTIASAASPTTFLGLDESSIPFNAAAMQIIYQYAHGKYPWIKVGYSPDQSKSPDAALELYRHGAMADFGQDEDYEDAYQTGGNPWQTTHALYPALIRVGLVEGTTTYCARAGTLAGVHGRYQLHQDYLDVLGVWSVDNLSDYHLWGYPIADPMIAQMMVDHAQAGYNIDCQNTFSIDTTGGTVQGGTPIYPESTLSGHGVSRTITDSTSVTSYNTPPLYSLTGVCDWRSFSGINVNLGYVQYGGNLVAPATDFTQTNPSAPSWDTRTCNGTLTVTVGAGQMCRDEVTSPITGYIDNGAGAAGTTLHVTGGTFNKNITYYVGITGGGVAPGTYVNGGTGYPSGGTTGTYTVTPSQLVGSSGSPASMFAQWGLSTCAVEFRAHNDSSAGTGITTDDVYNTFWDRTGLLIPLYEAPPAADYDTLISLKGTYPNVPVTVILNPASGPGSTCLSNYTTVIGQLRAAGISVVGYVDTNYAAIAQGTVETDVAKWKSCYSTMNGIFFDRMDNTSPNLTYYEQLTTYVHGLGMPISIGNAGTTVPSSYFTGDAVDVAVISETSGFPALGVVDNGGVGLISQKAILVYNTAYVPSNVSEAKLYNGMVYFTDGTGGNPWATLPTYISAEFAGLAN